MTGYWTYARCEWCDGTFTQEEYDERVSPHEDDCPNVNEWDDGVHHIDCDCDRNFHVTCWDANESYLKGEGNNETQTTG